MSPSFDPRAWNLLAGVTLAATACGGRTIGAEAGETGDASSGPECVTNEDCPYGYYCSSNQTCEYSQTHDGSHWGYECYVDEDCNELLELCIFNYCEGVDTPPSCTPGIPGRPPPLPIPEAPLGLSFADVDDDGADELVVATSAQLHLFESGSDVAIVSARELDSQSITAIAAGHFDPAPGEDLLILVDDELHLYLSDGAGNFASPVPSPSPVELSTGLLAGDFDGQGFDDMLVWGGGGAIIDRGGGDFRTLTFGSILFAVARDQATLSPGFALRGGSGGALLSFYDLPGDLLDEQNPRGTLALGHTSLVSNGTLLDVTATRHQGWNLLEAWDPQATTQQSLWGLELIVSNMLGGDLDGDGNDELVMLADGDIWIHRGALDVGECLEQLELGGMQAADLALGDHDGDGDQELALRFEDGTVAVFEV